MEKEFEIAFGAWNAARRLSHHGEAAGFGGLADAINGAAMKCGIADDAAATDGGAVELELRLDEQNEVGARSGERDERGENFGEADKRQVGGDKLGRFGDVRGDQKARVLFDGDDARVLAKFPSELAGGDVDGVDAKGARLQQAIGKAAGRAPDVDTDQPGGIHAEVFQRSREFCAGTAGECGLTAGDFQRRVERDVGPGLGLRSAGDADAASEDERLGALARLSQAPLNEQKVEPPFLDFRFSDVDCSR